MRSDVVVMTIGAMDKCVDPERAINLSPSLPLRVGDVESERIRADLEDVSEGSK